MNDTTRTFPRTLRQAFGGTSDGMNDYEAFLNKCEKTGDAMVFIVLGVILIVLALTAPWWGEL